MQTEKCGQQDSTTLSGVCYSMNPAAMIKELKKEMHLYMLVGNLSAVTSWCRGAQIFKVDVS